MIKKIRSKLSVKVFLLTAILMLACSSITYLCIFRFAPYIYKYEPSDVEYLAREFAQELFNYTREESTTFFDNNSEIFSEQYEDEYRLHIFNASGDEIALPYLDEITGKNIIDYNSVTKTDAVNTSFANDTNTYTIFIAQNSHKQSQVVEALYKALPLLSIIIVVISVLTAFFYAWYMTAPIKKVSKISEQLASLDFSGFCFMERTDEIGVLSDSLNILSKKLTDALSELQTANQKLQADINMERELQQQRVKFFSAASHELKTPITVIKGQLQGMLYQVGRYKDRETYLAQSLEVIDSLEKMVQELLTISRLDSSGYTCSKSNINMSKLINDRLDINEDLFIRNDLAVERKISPDLYISGDSLLLQKVVDNLLSNAAAYSPAGNQVLLKLWKDSEGINLTLENTGVHIPDKDIGDIFEAFYRVEQSRNRQTGGTGLGLYIVKTILDLHNAEIKTANTKQGVIVYIQFQNKNIFSSK
ncbi:HAMP domain-containing histidine kinase [Blautia schinkii]|nr:HAMP domain-containing histidine kinase [Blautia schinkii]